MSGRANKRTSIELKRDILKLLSNNKIYSISFLERRVKSDWETIKKHCEELEIFGGIVFEDSKIKISEEGFKFLEKLNLKLNKK